MHCFLITHLGTPSVICGPQCRLCPFSCHYRQRDIATRWPPQPFPGAGTLILISHWDLQQHQFHHREHRSLLLMGSTHAARAFGSKTWGKLFKDPQLDVINRLPNEKVFVVSWVDYCNKYSMGYALTAGTVGIYFIRWCHSVDTRCRLPTFPNCRYQSHLQVRT